MLSGVIHDDPFTAFTVSFNQYSCAQHFPRPRTATLVGTPTSLYYAT